jgi:hypothetical protein
MFIALLAAPQIAIGGNMSTGSPPSGTKPILTEQHVAEIKKKLDEMKGKELTKGQTIKLNGPSALWSVNYST